MIILQAEVNYMVYGGKQFTERTPKQHQCLTVILFYTLFYIFSLKAIFGLLQNGSTATGAGSVLDSAPREVSSQITFNVTITGRLQINKKPWTLGFWGAALESD